MKRKTKWIHALLAAVVASWAISPAAVVAQDAGGAVAVRKMEHEGAAALGIALRRLGTAKRVLMIAAHPDDENTQILSTLALGQGAEVAYLSLTRGEGGQNGIGGELQEGLGLLRSEELLAARRLDGARQYFSRAYDYGYSKSVEEALSRWPREEILADVVAVIRDFRPDVVVSIFSGTAADGHGQHQMAGLMAREGYSAAGDPARFSGEEARGLAPHAPVKLYQALWRGEDNARTTLETGELDPLLGRSYFQIAMASRGRHRSQDMGRLEVPGPQSSSLRLLDTRLEGSVDGLFAGVDTLLSQRARTAGAHEASDALYAYEQSIAGAREEFNPLQPGRIVPRLADAAGQLRRAIATATPPALLADLEEERARLSHALALAAGVRLDATMSSETAVPGRPVDVTLKLWNGGDHRVRIGSLNPVAEGWSVESLDALPPFAEAGTLVTRRFRLTPPSDLHPTEPYFLRAPREGDLYQWPENGRLAHGVPFQAPPLMAFAGLEIDGAAADQVVEVTYQGLDPRSGEFRRPVRVVPAVSLLPEQPAVVVSTATTPGSPVDRARTLSVRLRSAGDAEVSGTLRLIAPDGWAVSPAELPLTFAAGGEERVVEVTVTPPAALSAGDYEVDAVFTTDAREYRRGYTLVDYPHISPRPLYRPARVVFHAIDVRIPAGLQVGYVAGAGDVVPEVLTQLGVSVTLLGPQELATGALADFDAIVTGIRAYEVRPDLITHNQRLLDYARSGGTLIVQYNKYEYADPGIAPFPVEFARPHDRVTDPAAPVTFLDPDHPVLAWPNRITAADFDGWVQERGLYHLRSWGEAFTPLLEMADPGEQPQRGSLLVAPYGDGTYVYTGLAFFRQLPAGVPGAYRLFANLISLGSQD